MRAFDPDREWFATGDVVELRGDRVWFVGRRSGTINVGGSKVYPEEVERVIRSVPGVGEVRVYGRRSAVTGEVVCADVRPCSACDASALESSILSVCRQRLARHKVPALVQFSTDIAVTPSGKLARDGD
jgi:acyl-CoA synthetase (AMP-forming)/AMP-acid ligase II